MDKAVAPAAEGGRVMMAWCEKPMERTWSYQKIQDLYDHQCVHEVWRDNDGKITAWTSKPVRVFDKEDTRFRLFFELVVDAWRLCKALDKPTLCTKPTPDGGVMLVEKEEG